MHRIINDNIDKIKTLCIKHYVKSLFAFGSVCTEKFNDSSDIDLLISFKSMDYGDYADNYFLMADKLDDEIIWGIIVRHLPILKKEVNNLMK